MTKIYPSKEFLTKLYYNAGQDVNTDILLYCSQYIYYDYLKRIVNCYIAAPSDRHITVCDCFGAFFDKLCRYAEQFTDKQQYVIVVFDPYYAEKTVCQLYIPCQNTYFINKPVRDMCQADKLYTFRNTYKAADLLHFSADLFEKSYKSN